MIRLLRVELVRFRWRRAVLLLVAAAVIVPTVIFAATAWNTRPVSGAELQQIQQQVKEDASSPSYQRQVRRCVDHPQRYGAAGEADVQAACEDRVLPQVEWYTGRSPLDLDNERRAGSGFAVSIVLTMLLLLLGTTFVGHDWNSGSMSNQLLFEPRRLRVWAAKGAVVLLAGTVVAGVVLLAYWTGLWLVAEHRDVVIRDGAVSAAYHQAFRAALLGGFAGLGGYALTMLFRSTVATLGVLFAVSIAGPLLITILNFPGGQKLMPQNNYGAIMVDHFSFTDYDSEACQQEQMRGEDGASCQVQMSKTRGTLYFGSLLLLAGVPSVLSFRRRDVP
ncbi:MAG: family transporter protein [Nocardioides sp.]|jgi:ABC-2 type transport system permease protein|nr:family transporter protein [Nocardioides sp.]